MDNNIQVGVQTTGSDGSKIVARAGRQGDAIVSSLHGRYYEQTFRGNMFGITGGATTTTAEGAATFTGLIVGNPLGSGYNLAINKVSVSQVAALTAGTRIGVMYGINTTTVSLTTIRNRMAGGRDSIAVANAGQTITAMTAFIAFAGSGSGAITVPLQLPGMGYDFEGGLIIPPGYAVASYTSVASTTALVWTFNWEEVPI
jgi:hypothetical protein